MVGRAIDRVVMEGAGLEDLMALGRVGALMVVALGVVKVTKAPEF